MKSVNVFFRGDGAENLRCVQVCGKRKLNQYAAYFRRSIQLLDEGQKLIGGRIGRKAVCVGDNAGFAAGFFFRANINLAGGIISGDDYCGNAAIFCFNPSRTDCASFLPSRTCAVITFSPFAAAFLRFQASALFAGKFFYSGQFLR